MLNINAKLKDLVTDFLKESENFAPNTFTRREMHMRKNIVPVLGHMKVREIRNAHVKKFYNDVLNNEGINKVREIHFVLNVFFKWAVENEIAIDSNPISEGLIKSLKQKANRKELEDGVGSKDEKINIEEVLGFMKSLRGTREEVIYSLQIHSGLRISEALALTFEDIDMENETVSINKQVIEMAVNKRKGTRWESIKGMRMITPTKTKNSNRIVPLQPTVARIISETPEEEKSFNETIDDLVNLVPESPGSTGTVDLEGYANKIDSLYMAKGERRKSYDFLVSLYKGYYKKGKDPTKEYLNDEAYQSLTSFIEKLEPKKEGPSGLAGIYTKFKKIPEPIEERLYNAVKLYLKETLRKENG